MAIIEKHLHEHFANLQDDNEPVVPASAVPSTLRDSAPEVLDRPFAKVNSVAENSPAATAGLKPGDLVRNFGYVNYENHDNLRKVAECVQGNEGVSNPSSGLRRDKARLAQQSGCWPRLTAPQQNVFVKVSRGSAGSQAQELRLTLIPRRGWGGRGLLGCHILPL